MQTFREPIRLVIWDLDETLWQGTLEEGEVSIPPEHVAIVQTLARRGIVSSVCSKNDHAAAKAKLEAAGLWSWLVFPRIQYTFKSTLVADMLEQIGLRPESVLLVDDNPFNRGEVAERVPGINVAAETIIAELLDHPQLKGKPDGDLTRLKRYRVLETKQTAIAAADDPAEFLRACNIVVSLHFDVEEQFERVHELVNRTNQLNFTRQRWNEDVETARAEYRDRATGTYGSHSGYIKVRDRYGCYGICGFFETIQGNRRLNHFLFSCRVLNMGVEQFLYQNLGFPALKTAGTIVTRLVKSKTVDWITIVPDAEQSGAASPEAKPVLCMHGPCELAQSIHYLRPHFEMVEEFQYARAGWAIQRPLLRNLLLADEFRDRNISSPADLGLPADFPGLDMKALGSAMFSDSVGGCLWSFSLEPHVSLYRHRETGLIMPLSIPGFDRVDMTALAFDALPKNPAIKRNHFEAFRNQFAYVGLFDREVFCGDLAKLRDRLCATGKRFIVIDGFDNFALLDRRKYRLNHEVNRLVLGALAGVEHVYHVPFSECVADASEELGLNHFGRQPYMRLAERIRLALEPLLAAHAPPTRQVPSPAPATIRARLSA